jgi:hypothetical protein
MTDLSQINLLSIKLELLHHKLAVLERLGISISKDAKILDYGCRAGQTVLAAVNDGFLNCQGFDIVDYLADDVRDRKSIFSFNSFGSMPYADESFDLVVSD